MPTAERPKAIGPLLKLYQNEIDTLSKRGNKATKAYLALLGGTRALEASATADGGDALAAALEGGGAGGGGDDGAALQAQLDERTAELSALMERVDTLEDAKDGLEDEKARLAAQLDQVTSMMEREAVAKAELDAEVVALREAAASASPRHSSAEVEEWQSTVASLQEELRTAHETRQEWEAQAGAAHTTKERLETELRAAKKAAEESAAQAQSVEESAAQAREAEAAWSAAHAAAQETAAAAEAKTKTMAQELLDGESVRLAAEEKAEEAERQVAALGEQLQSLQAQLSAEVHRHHHTRRLPFVDRELRDVFGLRRKRRRRQQRRSGTATRTPSATCQTSSRHSETPPPSHS